MKSPMVEIGRAVGFGLQYEVAKLGEIAADKYEKVLGRKLTFKERNDFFDGFWGGIA